MTDEKHPRGILRSAGLRAHRRLGQNFLVDDSLMERIVDGASLDEQNVVLEIGTGLGRLTARLAERAGAVVSVEVDRGLQEIASRRLAGIAHLSLLHADFLHSKHRINPEVTEAVRCAAEGRNLKVVSNLPYQISSPALVNLLEWELEPVQIDVMLQAEVVDRITAAPGRSSYGPLTVFVRTLAETEVLFSAPPSAFWPRPAVSSRFLRATPRPPSPVPDDYELFCAVVNRLLQNRRKTLRRALRIGWDRGTAEAVLERVGLETNLRPDKLAPSQFVQIANALSAIEGG